MRPLLPSRVTTIVLSAAVLAALTAQTIPPDALMRGGRIHYEGGRYQRAQELFQKALDQYGQTADNATLANVYLWLGLAAAQLKEFSAAADHFVKVVGLDTSLVPKIRKDETWMYHVGTSLLKAAQAGLEAGNFEAAVTYALAAIRVDPTKPQVYSLVARAYSALGRFEEMRGVARDLLKLDITSAEAFGLLGLYYLQKPDSLWTGELAGPVRWDSAGYYYDRAIAGYAERFDKAWKDLEQKLRVADAARLDEIAWQLVARSRTLNRELLKNYIEKDLKVSRDGLAEVADIASRLHSAANSINLSSSRAGTAMLRASSETRGDTADRFRARAEDLFAKSVQYDSGDFTAMFNLGITYYQGKKDGLAVVILQRVVDGTVVPLGSLPQSAQDEVLKLITPAHAAVGYLQISGPLAAQIDSIVAGSGKPGIGYSWVNFPDLRERNDFSTASSVDVAGMFVSAQQPELLEQTYLWLGSSQIGMATSMDTAKQKDARTAAFAGSIANLKAAIKLNPKNADAYQNLGICYRETGQKDLALKAFETAGRLRGDSGR